MRGSALLNAKPGCVGCTAANRTCGLLIRNQPLCLLSYGDIKWCPWQDSHPHWTASEAVVSALDYMGIKDGGIGWIRTTNSPLQRRMLC